MHRLCPFQRGLSVAGRPIGDNGRAHKKIVVVKSHWSPQQSLHHASRLLLAVPVLDHLAHIAEELNILCRVFAPLARRDDPIHGHIERMGRGRFSRVVVAHDKL